ncbi:hypothetical protein PAPYR_6204 [Paratrimastix pyriformis]|uniref:Nudix hydrolase domain-containing protein n=1 Tax=Paratrimastix pyriformis TaxID=342808 RepID=A0ABQ8UFN4_9EUKA|nr:hypothetical protein PAPYR_6204 [Paratrimastix pyriformis]
MNNNKNFRPRNPKPRGPFQSETPFLVVDCFPDATLIGDQRISQTIPDSRRDLNVKEIMRAAGFNLSKQQEVHRGQTFFSHSRTGGADIPYVLGGCGLVHYVIDGTSAKVLLTRNYNTREGSNLVYPLSLVFSGKQDPSALQWEMMQWDRLARDERVLLDSILREPRERAQEAWNQLYFRAASCPLPDQVAFARLQQALRESIVPLLPPIAAHTYAQRNRWHPQKGGKKEPGEDDFRCASRESEEECGLRVATAPGDPADFLVNGLEQHHWRFFFCEHTECAAPGRSRTAEECESRWFEAIHQGEITEEFDEAVKQEDPQLAAWIVEHLLAQHPELRPAMPSTTATATSTTATTSSEADELARRMGAAAI